MSRVPRILGAVVIVEGGLDRERRFVMFVGAGFDPAASRASPSRERAVVQPDKVSRHGRSIFAQV